MKSIFIGIPTIKSYQPFWDSLSNFIFQIKDKYNYEIFKVENKPIAEARNEIVDNFLKSDKDYLLFLDDDHVGHSIEMLDSLLDPVQNNNSFMCGIKCYTKTFPYNSNICLYSYVDEEKLGIVKGSGKYVPMDLNEGYLYCDLIGFGMTLMTRDAFRIVNKPYFVSENNIREDNYFCDQLIKAGVQPVGCFNHTLEHNGIGSHNARTLRNEGLSKIREKYPDMKVLVA